MHKGLLIELYKAAKEIRWIVRGSDEPPLPTTCEYLTPARALRKRADRLEKQDAAIYKFQQALKRVEEWEKEAASVQAQDDPREAKIKRQ